MNLITTFLSTCLLTLMAEGSSPELFFSDDVWGNQIINGVVTNRRINVNESYIPYPDLYSNYVTTTHYLDYPLTEAEMDKHVLEYANGVKLFSDRISEDSRFTVDVSAVLSFRQRSAASFGGSSYGRKNLTIGVGMALNPLDHSSSLLNQDEWALLACHEFAHGVLQYPETFEKQFTGYKCNKEKSSCTVPYINSSNNENLADYVAAGFCMPLIFKNDSENADFAQSQAFDPKIKTICDRRFSQKWESDRCIRIASAGLNLARWLRTRYVNLRSSAALRCQTIKKNGENVLVEFGRKLGDPDPRAEDMSIEKIGECGYAIPPINVDTPDTSIGNYQDAFDIYYYTLTQGVTKNKDIDIEKPNFGINGDGFSYALIDWQSNYNFWGYASPQCRFDIFLRAALEMEPPACASLDLNMGVKVSSTFDRMDEEFFEIYGVREMRRKRCEASIEEAKLFPLSKFGKSYSEEACAGLSPTQ